MGPSRRQLRRTLAARSVATIACLTATLTTTAFGQTAPQAGGLQAPMAPESANQQIVRELDRAEREDTGRGLAFLWLNVASGYRHIWLQALSTDDLLAPGLSDRAGALNLEAAAGVQLLFLTAGARLQRAGAKQWTQWSMAGELGLHFPLGNFEPSLSLVLGYAWLTDCAPSTAGGTSSAAQCASGLNVELTPQLDWYPHPVFSVGARGGLGLLSLSSTESAGSGLGVSLTASLTLGLHL